MSWLADCFVVVVVVVVVVVLFFFVFCFQAKAEGHHLQVMIIFNVCSWKTSCFGRVSSLRNVLNTRVFH